MLHDLIAGLTSLGALGTLVYLVAGSLIGVFVGVIPGLSGAVVMSIMLAFAYHMSLAGTLCLFLGGLAGSYYSASITSILLNTPAHPEAYAVTLDGYRMARKGQAPRALGLSAASTLLGGFVGCLVLVGAIQIMGDLPNIFHPPEYLAVITIAMLLVGTLGTDSLAKALASMGIGFAISSMGPSNITGVLRFNFGMVELIGGVSIVALSMALFAVPQMIMVFGTKTSVAKQDMSGNEVDLSDTVEMNVGSFRQLLGGVAESCRHWVANIQAGLVGAFAGIIPGMGGFTANFLSYGVARQLSRKRDQFGTGIPEGVIAPEGSSLAKEAGHMIPLLGLGIPGGVGGALFIAALTIQGVRVGFGFETQYPVLAYQIVWVIALSGLIGTAAGVLSGAQLAKVTKVPGPILVPFLFAMSVIGPFLADVSFFSVGEVLVFGIIGLVLRRLKFSLATLILGLVLGPTFESNIYLIPHVYNGLQFLQKQPIADALFGIGIVILIAKVVETRRERAKRRSDLEVDLADVSDPVLRAEVIRARRRKTVPYPLLDLITTAVLVAVGAYWAFYSMARYDLATGLFATVAGFLILVPMVFHLPFAIRDYRQHRKSLIATSSGGQAPASPQTGAATTERDGYRPAPAEHPVGPGSDGLIESESGLVALEVRAPSAEPDAASVAGVAAQVPGADVVDRSWGRNGQYRRELIAVAWLAGLIVGCYLVGFVWAVPIFMFAYGMTSCSDHFRTRRSKVLFSVLSAVAMWLVTWLLIDVVLHLPFSPVIPI